MSPKTLRPLHRFITTHNQHGKATFSSAVSEQMPVTHADDVAHFNLPYTTSHFPAQMGSEADIAEYQHYIANPPGLTISSGSVCRIVDMAPNAVSPMHRTVSLDYGVVLEGEVELVLDSGETRLLRKGDVAVQRGTNHAWRNATPDQVSENGERQGQWARVLFVLMAAQEIEVEGSGKLGESGIEEIGVRSST